MFVRKGKAAARQPRIPRCGAGGRRGPCPLVANRMGEEGAVARLGSRSNPGMGSRRCGCRRRAAGVRTLRPRRAWHPGSGRSHRAFGRRRALSLCQESDVPGRRGDDRRTGTEVLGQPLLLLYAGAFLLTVAAFVHWYEEPTLCRQFGADYETYLRAVHRLVAAPDALEQPLGREGVARRNNTAWPSARAAEGRRPSWPLPGGRPLTRRLSGAGRNPLQRTGSEIPE